MAKKYFGAKYTADLAKYARETAEDPWLRLRNGIILQAVADYRVARRFVYDSQWLLLGVSGKRKKNYLDRLWKEQARLKEVERFFASEWFTLLTDIDGQVILNKIAAEAQEYERKER